MNHYIVTILLGIITYILATKAYVKMNLRDFEKTSTRLIKKYNVATCKADFVEDFDELSRLFSLYNIGLTLAIRHRIFYKYRFYDVKRSYQQAIMRVNKLIDEEKSLDMFLMNCHSLDYEWHKNYNNSKNGTYKENGIKS